MNNEKISRIETFRDFMRNAFSEDDVDILTTHLDRLGFFTAPASTKYHGAYEGGLFCHSFEVATELVNLTNKLGLQWKDPRSPYLIGMMHDICKCDNYIVTEDGIEYNKNLALTGHGDKSVILLSRAIGLTRDFNLLTDEEILCVRWHMGAFDDKENWGAYNRAIQIYPNVLYTHTADMIASQITGI